MWEDPFRELLVLPQAGSQREGFLVYLKKLDNLEAKPLRHLRRIFPSRQSEKGGKESRGYRVV